MIQKAKGLLYEDNSIEVFFGNKFFDLSELTNMKSSVVHTLKQTHSDTFHSIHRSEPIHPEPEGDALGTQLPKQYLAIKTADCLPIMIHDPDSNKISAIHAGWKGVAIGIVPKVVANYFKNSKHLRLFIGPHITKNSFEIRIDVLQQLKASVLDSSGKQLSVDTRADKFYVDLVDVVRMQLQSRLPGLQLDIKDSNIDTKTTEDYNSHRRNPQNTDRNISYIRLK